MKKVITIILLIIFIVFIVIIVREKINKTKLQSIETISMSVNNNVNEQILEVNEEEPREIKIYDIEEGYLTVPFNKKATKNDYDWNNLSKTNNGYYQYKDNRYETKMGIDVSSYQGKIDWEKVKNEGIEFAVLRLGFRGYGKAGKIVLDEKFEENYKNALYEGIKLGVYFFSQAVNEEEVIEEADFVLKNLEGKQIEYPIFYDLEKIKNDTARTDNLTIDEINNFTHVFCDYIKDNGYSTGIYGNAKTYTTRMKLEEFNDYTKWYADYQEKPIYPYAFDFWQYTESGSIAGIETNVDINIKFVKK